jgi:hypothetical protein
MCIKLIIQKLYPFEDIVTKFNNTKKLIDKKINLISKNIFEKIILFFEKFLHILFKRPKKVHQNNELILIQVLKPEILTEKKWIKEHENDIPIPVYWNHSILSIPLSYSGGYIHTFKASILDITSSNQKSFVVFLEDQNKNDELEANIHDDVKVDLKDFSKPGTLFKVMCGGWKNSAIKLGEITFE